ARKISKRYEEALRPVALKAGQFTILASLQRERPAPLGALAAALGMDRTTLTKDLRPLERRGLVTSVADEEDARVRRLKLTPQGRALLKKAVPLWQTAQKVSYERLADADWPDLRRALDRLAD
ncbi:MAG TPA: MarR family transcriptional regulator, partial [Kiloniellaceae bacterium]|nr:MarR family transcriptional regulator [Kiloniellaceae bacterium]